MRGWATPSARWHIKTASRAEDSRPTRTPASLDVYPDLETELQGSCSLPSRAVEQRGPQDDVGPGTKCHENRHRTSRNGERRTQTVTASPVVQ